MNFYADSNYIHARIYALHSQLLRRKDYNDIAGSGHFQSVMPGLDMGNIKNNSTVIKEKIFESQSGIVIQLAEASESTRHIFILFLRYFEALNLKLLCAQAYGHTPDPSIWYNIGDFAVIGREIPAGNSGIRSMIELTGDTWMKSVFSGKEAATFEDAERLIDSGMFRMAKDFLSSINLTDREFSMELAAGVIAYLRITWSRRLQYIYHMEPGSISGYIGTNITVIGSKKVFKRLVSEQEFKFLKMTGAADYKSGEGLSGAERAMQKILIRNVSRMFHRDFHSVNTVTCYLLLLFMQIRNLFSLADGLRFGLPPDVIMENIICED
jgi:vacuolar-type H+-ATPase subunit C/Vma6